MSQRVRSAALATLVLCGTLACDGGETTGPSHRLVLSVQGGDDQLGGPGTLLLDPLQVIVLDDASGEPVEGITVRWRVIEGAGATLDAETLSRASGVAENRLRLGDALGPYVVEATVGGLVGEPATFSARAVDPPVLERVEPDAAAAGDTVSVFGTGFLEDAGSNAVLFAGIRGVVVEASATRLRVVVPTCVPSRSADVRVVLGNVASNPLSIEVQGAATEPLALEVGSPLVLGDGAALSCLRLPAQAGARYLLLAQNGSDVVGRSLGLRIAAAAADTTGVVATDSGRVGGTLTESRSALVERTLRASERRLLGSGARPARRPAAVAAETPPPSVGDRRSFWVYSGDGFERITAGVRAVSTHAVLYQDLEAPSGGFGPGDFERFGALFDDPIHPALVDVYGAPSDLDGNGRIIILFTPVVNRLTPSGSGGSFVAGFFYGIDLLDHDRGNQGEIFYTLVPDPEGEHGDVRTFDQMLTGVPPVLAHEFQHMIHFNQRVLVRDAELEAPWLSEGLAHSAEELVGDAYLQRGDTDRAFVFKLQNYLRAESYLEAPEDVSPLDPETPLAVRGAAWLLVEYLRQHFGGDDLLTELTQTTRSSVANATGATGLPWHTLLARWGTALWADDLEIAGLDPVYTLPELDLRALFEGVGYPLVPHTLPFGDFARTVTLPASAASYHLLDAGASPAPLNLVLTRRDGSTFGDGDEPLVTLLRLE